MVAESELRRDYDVPEDQSVGGQSADVRIESTDYFLSCLLPMVGIGGCLVGIRRHVMSSLFDIRVMLSMCVSNLSAAVDMSRYANSCIEALVANYSMSCLHVCTSVVTRQH